MKLLLCDDSIIMRNILREVLEEQGLEIAGEAGNGKKALEMNRKLDLDAIIMDINMPTMNGLEATKAIMEEKPVPIVIFSNEVDSKLSFEALHYGAMEVMRKPDMDAFNDSHYVDEFIETLRSMAKRGLKAKGNKKERGAREMSRPVRSRPPAGARFEAMVIGASTGGPLAVKEILRKLPPHFPVGIALVQHIEDRFDTGYAKWLDDECEIDVRMAQEGDFFEPGVALVAPGNRHLICRNKRLYHDDGPKFENQKPSVNRLFESSAECYGDRLLGVLLTGMGSDGGRGCLRIREAGGYTVVQDKESSLIYGMPKAAVDSGGASVVLGLEEIGPYVIELVKNNG